MRNLNLIIFIALLGCIVSSSSPITSASNSSNSSTQSTSKLRDQTSQIQYSTCFSILVCLGFIILISRLIFYVNSGKKPFKVYIYLIYCICYFSNCVKVFLQSLQTFLDYFNISAEPWIVVLFVVTAIHLIALIVDTTYDCLKKPKIKVKNGAWMKVSNVNDQVSSKNTYQYYFKIDDAESILACLANINHDAPPSYQQKEN